MSSRPVMLAVSIALAIQTGAAGAQPRPATELYNSLGHDTESFLKLWLQGDPSVAVEKYLSPTTVRRPDLLPSPTDFENVTGRGVPADRSNARELLIAELLAVRRELSPRAAAPVLSPTNRETASEIVSTLGERNVDVRMLERPSAIAFQVKNWSDIAWIGSARPVHRDLLRSGELLTYPLFAVVVRLTGQDPNEAVPVLLLWEHRRDAPAPHWQLVTLLPVLTR
jgi:hypothetical protein